ncbi:MAG: transglycosylase domain-containing protein, partial [Actinomycetota bacterium]|nr:transglycosylase domain-containing protein [Actinomycetota bacterium]
MSKILKLVLCLVFASAFVAASVVAVAPGAARVFDAGHSTPEALFLNPLDERSLVFDAAGGLRATLYGEQNRAPVPLSAIPEQVINAVLDVEDQNFWSHEGVNLRSTVRALFENVAAGGVAQGGSTITMQVVKSVMGDETSLERKSREAILALRLEEQLTKEQILERYLNTVYFGNGAYGVQAAAETYWNVGVAELDWGQAALLASIIRYPDLYNPIRHPEVASERRRIALGLIVDAGHITEEQAGLYAYEPLPTQVSRIAPSADDYFLEEVKQILLDDPSYGIGSTPE